MEESYESDDEIRADLVQAATIMGREELKNRFVILDRPANKVHMRHWWVVVALILAMVAAFFLLKPTSTEALYADHYTKLTNKLVPITRGVSGNADLKVVMVPYIKGEYGNALKYISKLESEYPELTVYKGAIAMEEGRYDFAIEVLSPLSKDKTYELSEDASWYLALAYLKLESKEKVTEVLDMLISRNSVYSKKAQALMADL